VIWGAVFFLTGLNVLTWDTLNEKPGAIIHQVFSGCNEVGYSQNLHPFYN
jgi:hypothetical protein